MRKCLLANYDDGFVNIVGTAAQDFDKQLSKAERAEKLGDLIGWGQWTAIIRLQYDTINSAVFVVGTSN